MKRIITALIVASAFLSMASCNKNQQNDPYYEVVATIKPDNKDSACFFQIDDNTAMKPTNSDFATNPYGRQVRVRMLYYDRGEMTAPAGSPYKWRSGEVIALDTILTKKPVPAGGEYGTDKIEILSDWRTSCEDGYLTFCFECLWGDTTKPHTISLVETGRDQTYELRNNAHGDKGLTRSVGIIAFDISGMKKPSSNEFYISVLYSGYTENKVLRFHMKDGICIGTEFAEEN